MRQCGQNNFAAKEMDGAEESYSPVNRKLRFSHLYWQTNDNDPNLFYDTGRPFRINGRVNLRQTNAMFTENKSIAYVRPLSTVHSWEHLTLVPVLAMILLIATVFLLVIFRHSPALIAGTIAASLTIVCIYLTLSSLQNNIVKYE